LAKYLFKIKKANGLVQTAGPPSNKTFFIKSVEMAVEVEVEAKVAVAGAESALAGLKLCLIFYQLQVTATQRPTLPWHWAKSGRDIADCVRR